jgi:UDP-N-acetylmuramoyl-L-alanyl-D-glutamate--2,6-diaminopimelate ligase
MARWFVDRLPQRGIPSVSLRRLLPEAQFVGCADWEVSGCSDDHRRLDPGQVFVATRGARPGYDGHAFVREALERGAAGVVVEHPCADAGRLQVIVRDAMAAHARICQALAGDPSHHLLTAGVTGRFGRTITALCVRSILESAGRRTGSLGGLGFFDGTTAHPLGAGLDGRSPGAGVGAGRIPGHGPRRSGSSRTSLERPTGLIPGAASLAALLSEIVERGCKAAVLEASA